MLKSGRTFVIFTSTPEHFARANYEGNGVKTYSIISIVGALLTFAAANAAFVRG